MRSSFGALGLAAGLTLAAGLAAAACHDAPATQCLEPDGIAYRYSLPGDSTRTFRWPANRMPLRVYAEPVGNLSANTDAGLALWTAAPRCGGIAFVRTLDSTAADIVVRNPQFLPPAAPLAGRMHLRLFADSVGACTGVTQLDIDTSTSPWTLHPPMRSFVAHQGADSAATEACYHFTVAHELGHALGILSHSPNSLDLMNAVPKRPVASPNDRATIETLYLQSTSTIRLAP